MHPTHLQARPEEGGGDDAAAVAGLHHPPPPPSTGTTTTLSAEGAPEPRADPPAPRQRRRTGPGAAWHLKWRTTKGPEFLRRYKGASAEAAAVTTVFGGHATAPREGRRHHDYYY